MAWSREMDEVPIDASSGRVASMVKALSVELSPIDRSRSVAVRNASGDDSSRDAARCNRLRRIRLIIEEPTDDDLYCEQVAT